MCGIAGILSLGPDIDDRDRREARAMTACLRHRGPDSMGFDDTPRTAVGNARLNIIDLSANASLPMSGADGRVCIAYNGEVTNFRELRKEFRLDDRHRFRSSSDTEVLVHLYEELGIGFLKHLSGMFAMCLIDKKESKAWLIRDQYGIRPLFFMVANGRLYFASEIKSFFETRAFEPEIDREAMSHFFSLAYIPGASTPFSRVKELQGGMMLEIDLRTGTVSEQEYYRLEYPTDHSMTEDETAGRLHEVLLDSVRRNLIADVPIGLTLSGGFDTSTLLALVKELDMTRELHTYSIRINESSFDESRYQKIMVDFAKPIHHQIDVNPRDVVENMARHMAFMDEPSGDGAAVPSFLLAREAKKHVRVLLSGEGGDEVFNAYETHGAYKARELYRRYTTDGMRRLIAGAAQLWPNDYKKLSFDFVLKRFTQGAMLGAPEAHLFWRHVLTEEEKGGLLLSPASPTDRLFREMFDGLEYKEGLNRISHLDIKYYFIGDLRVKNDRTIMAHSIEARFPYMDRIIMDFASRIPPALKIKGFKRRYIQKRSMRGRLPDAILNRRNMGLEMPHSLWFMNGFRKEFEPFFEKKRIEKTGLLNADFAIGMWRRHLAGQKDYGRALWCIINLVLWFELFVETRDYKRYLSET